MAKKRIEFKTKDGKWHKATYYESGGEVYVDGNYIGKANSVENAMVAIRAVYGEIEKIEIRDE